MDQEGAGAAVRAVDGEAPEGGVAAAHHLRGGADAVDEDLGAGGGGRAVGWCGTLPEQRETTGAVDQDLEGRRREREECEESILMCAGEGGNKPGRCTTSAVGPMRSMRTWGRGGGAGRCVCVCWGGDSFRTGRHTEAAY